MKVLASEALTSFRAYEFLNLACEFVPKDLLAEGANARCADSDTQGPSQFIRMYKPVAAFV
jgi:hypothetical protein